MNTAAITDRIREALPAWIAGTPTGSKILKEIEALQAEEAKANAEKRRGLQVRLAEAKAAESDDSQLAKLKTEHVALLARAKDKNGLVRPEFLEEINALNLVIARRQRELRAAVQNIETALGALPPDPERKEILAIIDRGCEQLAAFWQDALEAERGEEALVQNTTQKKELTSGITVVASYQSIRPVVKLVSRLMHGPSHLPGQMNGLRGIDIQTPEEARQKVDAILARLPDLKPVTLRRGADGAMYVNL